MRDKRPVDELSIEELERILAIRKREARMERLRRYDGVGRRVSPGAPVDEIEEDEEEDLPPPLPQPIDPPIPVVPQIYYEDEPRFEDELDARRIEKPKRKSNQKVALKIWNRSLLVIELGAAAGLLFLVVYLFQGVQAFTEKTNQEQQQAQQTANAKFIPPTATPVINIAALVLPVGHTVRVNGNSVVADLNLDEVPAQYRDQYSAMMIQAPPPVAPDPEGPVRIRIPALEIDSTVVTGDNFEALKLGVGHHMGSANPGQRGNMVLSAHNDVYGEIFRHLDKLKPGDPIIVSTLTQEYTYVVQDQGSGKGHTIVQPTQVSVMDSRDDLRLTLISCYPYQVDNKRIVVYATMQ
jgi:sortase A